MGKMMSFALLVAFIVEFALVFTGQETTTTSLFNALINPPGLISGILFWALTVGIVFLALASAITPGFLYQTNQYALFAGAVGVLIYFVATFANLWIFLKGELIDLSPQFAGYIATLICSPLIITYILAGLEWTRFNQ